MEKLWVDVYYIYAYVDNMREIPWVDAYYIMRARAHQ